MDKLTKAILETQSQYRDNLITLKEAQRQVQLARDRQEKAEACNK